MMISWRSSSTLISQVYSSDPFLEKIVKSQDDNTNYQKQDVSEKNKLEQYMFLLKEYINYIELNAKKIKMVPDILLKKLIMDLEDNKKLLEKFKFKKS